MSGWISLHRSIVNSDIYHMPPLYLRVFERLILEANHQDNEIPYKDRSTNTMGKKLIKRGERLTSVRDICRWVGWYERGKFKEPNPKTIQSILDWLEENNMIFIYGDKGNRKETHYNIVNYNVYQGENIDESNSKVTEKKQSLETNNNVNNDNNLLFMYSEKMKEVVSLLQTNIGVIPPILIDGLNDYVEVFELNMFEEAIKIAANKKVRTVNYVLGIMDKWSDNNIITIESLEALRAEKKAENKKANAKAPATKTKNRFHNFEQRSDMYSSEELNSKVDKLSKKKRAEALARLKGE